jgi:hypothetical protein
MAGWWFRAEIAVGYIVPCQRDGKSMLIVPLPARLPGLLKELNISGHNASFYAPACICGRRGGGCRKVGD